MSVRNTVKSIQDIMRQDVGVDGDAQRISQLCWMFFLKIIDDQDKELEMMQRGYRSPIPEKLQWRSWAADPEGITGDKLLGFVNDELFPKLKELSAASQNGRRRVVRDVFEDAYNYMKSGQLILARNDILLNLVGASIGRSAIFELDEVANINQAVCIVRTISRGKLISLPFLLVLLNSEFGIGFMLEKQVDMARANLSMGNVSKLPVLFPPLAEQHRIVAKVDELMALCDQLEAQLTATKDDRRRLLEAVLHEALHPGEEVVS